MPKIKKPEKRPNYKRLGVALACRGIAEAAPLTIGEIVKKVSKKLHLEPDRIRAAVIAHIYGPPGRGWKKTAPATFQYVGRAAKAVASRTKPATKPAVKPAPRKGGPRVRTIEKAPTSEAAKAAA